MTDSIEYVKEYRLETAEDFIKLREDDEFCDDAVSLIRYNGVPRQLYINYDRPRFFGGLVARIGDVVGKDEAGNFYVNGKATRS